MNKRHARCAEANTCRRANASRLLLWLTAGLWAGHRFAVVPRSPGGAPLHRDSGELLLCLFLHGFNCLPRVVTPSLQWGTPWAERALILDDFIIYSLVPLVNQWAKGLPCATQLSRQMSCLPQPLTVMSAGLRARRATPRDGEAHSSQAAARDR